MNNPLPWFKIEILQVADDLSDVGSMEAEGAYFRILRHLWLNGPQSMEVIRRKCKKSFIEIEHVFNWCSTGVEPVFSISWLERQRDGVNEWREGRRQAGIKSGLSRAKKGKKRLNTSSTSVQLVSTSVEHATSTSTSTSILNSEKKGPKSKEEREADFIQACKDVMAKDPDRMPDEKDRLAFYEYWTEANTTTGKMLFETKPVFDHGRRMSRWMRNKTEAAR